MKMSVKGKQHKLAGKGMARGRAGRAVAGNGNWSAPDGELYKPIKKPVTLRLDADLLAWFKAQGRGYQTRINRALRGVMMKERKT